MLLIHTKNFDVMRESVGFKTENTKFYQYSISSGANGLNYVLLEKDFKDDDQVIAKFGPMGFMIFLMKQI